VTNVDNSGSEKMKAIRAIRSRRLPGDVARARESSPKRRESQDKGEEQATDASGVLTGVFTSPSLSRREDEVEKEKQVQRLHALAKDRVHGDALVLAEVKTNVIVCRLFLSKHSRLHGRWQLTTKPDLRRVHLHN